MTHPPLIAVAAVLLLSSAAMAAPLQERVARCPGTGLPDPLEARHLPQFRAALRRTPPLYQAIHRHDGAAVRRLLRQGADPRACAMGASLVARAASDGDMALLDRLLAAGASVDLPLNEADETPLLHALGEGRFDTALALIERGADASASAAGGVTALHVAVASAAAPAFRSVPLAERTAVLRRLLVRGARLNARMDGGRTPLRLAVDLGDAQVSAHLLAHGADPNLGDDHGLTPLALAASRARSDLVDMLKDAGASPMDRGPSLADAIERGDDIAIAALLSAMPRPDTLRPLARQALLLSALRDRTARSLPALVAWGVDVDMPLDTLWEDEHAAVTAVTLTLVGGLPPEALGTLLRAGANPDRVPAPPIFPPPLVHAISLHQAAAVALLLDRGADPNLADARDGLTPLMQAVASTEPGSPGTARSWVPRLLALGARTDARDRAHGMTPLHWAAMAGDVPVVRWLLAAGADRSALDRRQRTPLAVARDSGSRQAAALLLRSR